MLESALNELSELV